MYLPIMKVDRPAIYTSVGRITIPCTSGVTTSRFLFTTHCKLCIAMAHYSSAKPRKPVTVDESRIRGMQMQACPTPNNTFYFKLPTNELLGGS
jgi:hypothetical protein